MAPVAALVFLVGISVASVAAAVEFSGPFVADVMIPQGGSGGSAGGLHFAWDPDTDRSATQLRSAAYNSSMLYVFGSNDVYQLFEFNANPDASYCCHYNVLGEVPKVFWQATSSATAGTCGDGTAATFYTGAGSMLSFGFLGNADTPLHFGVDAHGVPLCATVKPAGVPAPVKVPITFKAGAPAAAEFAVPKQCADAALLARCPVA